VRWRVSQASECDDRIARPAAQGRRGGGAYSLWFWLWFRFWLWFWLWFWFWLRLRLRLRLRLWLRLWLSGGADGAERGTEGLRLRTGSLRSCASERLLHLPIRLLRPDCPATTTAATTTAATTTASLDEFAHQL